MIKYQIGENMVSLEQIKISLENNQYLTDDIKDNLFELTQIFNKTFNNVDLSNLNERFKTLKVIRGSKFLIRNSSFYNPIDNELLISLSKIDDDMDCKHILMRELLNIITAKDNYTGFNINNEYEALNIGYTEILTNLLVGNEGKDEFENEIIAANLLTNIIGEDNMYNAYFNNDISKIIASVS